MPYERVSGIYAFVNTRTGYAYVGSSSNIRKRLAGHLQRLRNGRHDSSGLQVDWNTFGPDTFTFHVLQQVHGEVLLLHYERIWLLRFANAGYALYNSHRPHRTHADTGPKIAARQRGRMLSAEWRANISAAKRGLKPYLTPEQRRKKAEQARNRVWTDASREKISLAKTGKSTGPFSPEARARMSAARLGVKYTNEVKAKRSAALKAWWALQTSDARKARLAPAHRRKK